MKSIIIAALLLAGCVNIIPLFQQKFSEFVIPAKETPEVETPKTVKCEENPRGPWYSQEVLRENPELHSDMYFCSNYYAHKHKQCTVPILCGPEDGECGILSCDCECH